MELGIGPIVTSGLVMQLLTNSNIIKFKKQDRAFLIPTQKLLCILIAIGQALAYVLSGMYSPVSQLRIGNAILIVLQLVLGVISVLCLDDLLQKGYGLGSSGSSLFIVTNLCESVIWKAFSPVTINGRFEGSLVSLCHSLMTKSSIRQAFFRQNLPNVANLLSTFLIFLIVVYFQGFRVVLPLKLQNSRGGCGAYPIKLFYTSNMPIILLSALVSNLYFISQLLYNNFSENLLVNLLGQWRDATPVGGFAYLITALSSLVDTAADPCRALFYVVFVLFTCAFFSKTWIEISGSSARDVSKQLKEQELVIPGNRECNLYKDMDRYISTSAAFGGMCIGALTILADLIGAIRSGTGILLAVSTIYQCFEAFDKEKSRELGYFGF